MAKRIRPVDLSKAINDILSKYGDEVYTVMESSIDEVSEEAKEKLRAVNHFRNDASGAYAESWVNEKLSGKPLTCTRAVHNEKHYRLTHLLEKGHVVRNGTGRNKGKQRTDAFPHIAPVNDWANKELVQLVERKLER